MIKIYNKLVRDKIPEIIRKDGKQCKVKVLDDEKYLKMLDEKLSEELNEYYADHSLEELADLYEVLRAVVLANGYTLEELEKKRKEKAENRGAFDEKILLESVEEY